jgi:hypothetical protein
MGNLCTSGGFHSGSTGTEDRSALLAWMAGAVEMVGACDVADVPTVPSVQRSDGRCLCVGLDRLPLW